MILLIIILKINFIIGFNINPMIRIIIQLNLRREDTLWEWAMPLNIRKPPMEEQVRNPPLGHEIFIF